jgi:hypothetical protein
VADTVHQFSIKTNTGIDAVIIAGEIGEGTLAFMVVKRENGEEVIFELEEFNLLTVYYEHEDRHGGLYTEFNKNLNLLISDYCVTYPQGKLGYIDSKTTEKTTASETDED